MKLLFLILLLPVVLLSCKKEENPPSPKLTYNLLKVGSAWFYKRQVILREYLSETSNIVIFSDSSNTDIAVSVEKDTLFNDTLKVKVVSIKETSDYDPITQYNYTTIQYKSIDSIGIKTIAYLNPTRSDISTKQSKFIASKHGILVNELMCMDLQSDEKIIILPKPILDLKFPIEENSSWIAQFPVETNPLQINKKVIGVEKLKGAFFNPCFKISWEYLNDPDFDGASVIEWISLYGPMKRQEIYKNVKLVNVYGDPVDGIFQIEVNWTIDSMYAPFSIY